MAFAGISTDFDWSSFTPLDSTGTNYDKFKSAYKNVRFNVQPNSQITLTSADVANFPGLAYRLFNDVSLWRALLAFNGLSDPISDLYVGAVLKVPTKSALTGYLSQLTQKQQQNTTIII